MATVFSLVHYTYLQTTGYWFKCDNRKFNWKQNCPSAYTVFDPTNCILTGK